MTSISPVVLLTLETKGIQILTQHEKSGKINPGLISLAHHPLIMFLLGQSAARQSGTCMTQTGHERSAIGENEL